MEDELLCHADSIQVLPIADLPQHVGDACCTRLLKRRKNPADQLANFRPSEKVATYVQMRYTCCSIRTCLFFRDCGVSFSSSSFQAGSLTSTEDVLELVGLLELIFTFQN